MITLSQVCQAHAALAMAEFDNAENVDQLRAERDRIELEYRNQ